MIKFKKIDYDKLTAKQQESYNFQKFSSVLADVGYTTTKLSDDWESADFLAQHIDKKTFIKIQLKSKFGIAKKYYAKEIFIALRAGEEYYLYPHDELQNYILANSTVATTESWKIGGKYHYPKIPKKFENYLKKNNYQIK